MVRVGETAIVRIKDLEEKSRWVRKQTLEMCAAAGSGHTVSSFSCTDILVALYYTGIFRFGTSGQTKNNRDRFILSKGHGGIGLYPILADLGFFPKEELLTFCHSGSKLGAHPDRHAPGIETVTGSLGHGLGIAAGLALSAKMDKNHFAVVTLLGDGECYEGSVWEAANFAGGQGLNNLMAIVDRNGLCVTDFTENFLRLEPLAERWKAFGWDTVSINGHSFKEIIGAFNHFRSRKSDRPLAIIARTIKGKGVSFMENEPTWHTQIPAGERLEAARIELTGTKRKSTKQV